MDGTGKQFARCHTTSEWPQWNLNVGCLMLESLILTMVLAGLYITASFYL